MFRCRRSAPARRRDACDFHAHEARASSCGSHFRMRQPAQGPNWNETTPCVIPFWRFLPAPLRPFEPGERWPRRCPLRGLSVMRRVGSMRRDSPYRLSRLALSAPKSSRARLSAAGPVKIATRQILDPPLQRAARAVRNQFHGPVVAQGRTRVDRHESRISIIDGPVGSACDCRLPEPGQVRGTPSGCAGEARWIPRRLARRSGRDTWQFRWPPRRHQRRGSWGAVCGS